LAATFFLATGVGFDIAAFFSVHRFFKAATMFALPAALSFRLAVGAAAGADGGTACLEAARLFRCASPMRFLVAALIFRRLPFGDSGLMAALSVVPPESIVLSPVISASMGVFCASNLRLRRQ
jgi:hypothetical protein